MIFAVFRWFSCIPWAVFFVSWRGIKFWFCAKNYQDRDKQIISKPKIPTLFAFACRLVQKLHSSDVASSYTNVNCCAGRKLILLSYISCAMKRREQWEKLQCSHECRIYRHPRSDKQTKTTSSSDDNSRTVESERARKKDSIAKYKIKKFCNNKASDVCASIIESRLWIRFFHTAAAAVAAKDQ